MGDADDVLRSVVSILHERGRYPWAAITFLEDGQEVEGPQAGEAGAGTSFPVSFGGQLVAYLHVAGGAEHDGLYHDTHTDPVPAAVLDLVREVCARHRPPAVMLERDGRYPPADALRAGLDGIAAASGYPVVTS